MPDEGTYLLTNVGFSSSEEPILLLQDGGTFIDTHPLGNILTLSFDMTTRFCIGWRDITSGEKSICPSNNIVDAKYEQCAACQKRTGFNPAFYHASSVSEQQEARNQQPHILYLAHFGPGVIKVGISHARRGNSRLLEQGARTALILDTFPTAHIARQYEAKIAKIPGIVETLQQRKKSDLFTIKYEPATAISELLAAKRLSEDVTGIVFTGTKPTCLDGVYFPSTIPEMTQGHNMTDRHIISGKAIGMIGAALFCQQDDALLYLHLKKHIGYKVEITHTSMPIETPAQQISLF